MGFAFQVKQLTQENLYLFNRLIELFEITHFLVINYHFPCQPILLLPLH